MPKPTFINLKTSKREAFLKDAFAEFAIKGYWGASITQLVKSLGIAKGSIYQYFEDKTNLYHHLVKEACQRKLTFFEVLKGKPEKDYTLSYLIISAKFDLTFPSQGLIIYQALSTFEEKILMQVKEELTGKIPATGRFADKVFQNNLLTQSQSLFMLLLERNGLSLIEAIKSGSSIQIPADSIVELVQESIQR